MHDMAVALRSAGHAVTALVRAPKPPERDEIGRAFPFEVVESDAPFKYFPSLFLEQASDVVIASVDAHAVTATLDMLPSGSCLFVRDDQGIEALRHPRQDRMTFVANSNYLARKVETVIGRRVAAFPPLIDVSRYRAAGFTRGNFVTFVNPVEKKGLSQALAIASLLPEIDFLFCEGWPQSPQQWAALEEACRRRMNVTLLRRQSDMRPIYARTRVLIVPSVWEEAWGRVVTEAQINGIPSIVSDVGGLPESCGEGGIVMPRAATPEAWADRIKRLFTSAAEYRRLSEAATRTAEAHDRRSATYATELLAWIDGTAPHTIPSVPDEDSRTLVRAALEDVSQKRAAVGAALDKIAAALRAPLDQSQHADLVFAATEALAGPEALIAFYERHRASLPLHTDRAHQLAIAFKQRGRPERAAALWRFLIETQPGNQSNRWRPPYADALQAQGREDLACDVWETLFRAIRNPRADALRNLWYRRYLACLRETGDVAGFERIARRYAEENPGDRDAARCLMLSACMRGDHETALESFRQIQASDGESAMTVDDCSLLTYLLMMTGRHAEAQEAVARAELLHGDTFRGPCMSWNPLSAARGQDGPPAIPDCRPPRHDGSTRTLSGPPGPHSSSSAAPRGRVVVSWPGYLGRNAFMRLFAASIREAGAIFLPIALPSDGVFPHVDRLLIQFPDCIRWWFGTEPVASQQRIMERQLTALRAWQAAGTKLSWIVHNLAPHDLPQRERALWTWFFSSLGDVVDEYHSLCPGNEQVIAEAIPTLAGKPYSWFYHPPYPVTPLAAGDRQSLRNELGVGQDDILIGVFGSIASYKGLDELIGMFRCVQDLSIRLLVVGWVRDRAVHHSLKHHQSADPRIIVVDEFVDEVRFEMLCHACDRYIVPTLRYLNSASLIHVLGFRRPALALRTTYACDVQAALAAPEQLVLVDDFYDPQVLRHFVTRACVVPPDPLAGLGRRSPTACFLD